MGVTYLGNIRGPRGIGEPGAQGLPGVNAVAADAAVAGYLGTTGTSATKTAANARDAARGRVAATVEYKATASGVRYSVVRVKTHGKFIPGLVSKEFALDYEKAGTTGANFKPVREDLDKAQVRCGAAVIANSSGWQISSNVNEILGAQIKDGVAYHDNADDSHGSDSLGFFADGRSRIYSKHNNGDTVAKMIADGVVDCFSFGPALVTNGVATDFYTDTPFYGGRYQGVLSARQIFGQSATGDIILVSVEGVSFASGLAGNDISALALAEGCYNAITMDSGGSVQTVVDGIYVQPSSDVARKRPVPDFIVLNTSSTSRAFDSGWIDLPLQAGFAANIETPAFRQVGSTIEFRGQVKPTSGNFTTDSFDVAILPSRFRATGAAKVFLGNGNGALFRKVVVNEDGRVQIIGDTTTPAYITLHSVRFSLD